MKKLTFLLLQFLIVFSGFAQEAKKYTSVNLNLREDSNTSSNVISVIPKGTAVTMAQDCDCVWILVSYQGRVGYVYSKYLTTNQPAQTQVRQRSVKHYTNSAGERIQSPTYYNSAPEGATALCRDGTYSFSSSRRGTCSHHGGVAKWL
ncbi:MAG: DUF3761 domain-containing protein [Paludibacter sp.]